MRALIQTEVFRKIDNVILLDIQNCAFKVFIREISLHFIPLSIVHDQSNGVSELVFSCDSDKSSREDEDIYQDSNENVPGSPLFSGSHVRNSSGRNPNQQSGHGDRSPSGNSLELLKQLSSSGRIEEVRRLNEHTNALKDELIKLLGVQAWNEVELLHEEEMNWQTVVLESESANNGSLAIVPAINDLLLVSAITAMGNEKVHGFEKSVEVAIGSKPQFHSDSLNQSNHQAVDDIPKDLDDDEVSSLSSGCESITNARKLIVEKAIKFGLDNDFMRAKKNINPKKHFEDKLSARKKKKIKESDRRKRASGKNFSPSLEGENL